MRFRPPGSIFTRQRATDFRTAPGPWQPSVNVPHETRSMSVPLVFSHRWPKQDRTAVLRSLADTKAYGFDPNVMLVPSSSTRSRGTGPNAMNALNNAQKRMGGLQAQILRKYVGGGTLQPAEVRELMKVRRPQGSSYEHDARYAFAQRHPGNPLGHAGARQITFDPTMGPLTVARLPSAGNRRLCAMIKAVAAKQSGKLGISGPPLVDARRRAMLIARASQSRRVIGGF